MAERSIVMSNRLFATAAILLVVAGCQRKEAAPEPVASETAHASERSSLGVAPRSASASALAPAHKLDLGALNERKDPDRVLRFYAAALHARDWVAAAKAWGRDSGVTATTLKASYDRADPPRLVLDKGEVEGAAGSLFYEAPVSLHFGTEGEPERGSLVLRRVNDVDGATPEQLRWHIERSTIGQNE
jgi:hypothetical protein